MLRSADVPTFIVSEAVLFPGFESFVLLVTVAVFVMLVFPTVALIVTVPRRQPDVQAEH